MRPITELIRVVNSLKCQGLCWYSCVEGLGISKKEDERIKAFCETTGIPYHDIKERMPPAAMAMKLRAAQTGAVEFEACPFLSADHQCTIYPVRPGICRTYGSSSTPIMSCQHGCEMDGPPLTRRETEALNAYSEKGGEF